MKDGALGLPRSHLSRGNIKAGNRARVGMVATTFFMLPQRGLPLTFEAETQRADLLLGRCDGLRRVRAFRSSFAAHVRGHHRVRRILSHIGESGSSSVFALIFADR